MKRTLTLRMAPAVADDLERLAEIQQASCTRLGDPISLTSHDLAAMQSWTRIGPDGVHVIRDDDATVGLLRYARFLDASTPSVLAIVTVDPERRDSGIADWTYEQILERARSDGAAALDTVVDSRDMDTRDFLKHRDFEQLVSVWTMEADPDFAPAEAPQPSSGFHLRVYRIGEDAALLTDLYNRTFDQHVTFAPSTVEETRSIETTPGFDPDLTTLLETDGGEAVAYARTTLRADPNDAWIDILGVIPEYQGRGLGRYMLLDCMYRLAQARPRAIRLSVEGINDRATALYDSEGFMKIRTRICYRKSLIG